MNENMLSAFEKRLLNEVAMIETRIKELTIEKAALQRQIAKSRAERTGLQTVTRKNSLNRVLAENSVIQILRDRNIPLTTNQLYQNALITNFDLNENTFRNYLHRMKNRDLIRTAGRVGVWRLIEDQ